MESGDEERIRPVEPTASKEKWIDHARKKMERGYVLIVNKTRRNANFFMPGKGYEMCSFHAAQKLIDLGIVVETGTHYLGAVYTLQPRPTSVPL